MGMRGAPDEPRRVGRAGWSALPNVNVPSSRSGVGPARRPGGRARRTGSRSSRWLTGSGVGEVIVPRAFKPADSPGHLEDRRDSAARRHGHENRAEPVPAESLIWCPSAYYAPFPLLRSFSSYSKGERSVVSESAPGRRLLRSSGTTHLGDMLLPIVPVPPGPGRRRSA